MANIGSLLKTEIARVCRREMRQELRVMKKASAAHRRSIATLKRQVVELERKAAGLAKSTRAVATAAPAAQDSVDLRFQARGFRSLRQRLGLSAPQLAKLLKVSEQSVYNWETGKTTPRKAQLPGIVELRSLGKRDVQARLAASKTSKGGRTKRAARARG